MTTRLSFVKTCLFLISFGCEENVVISDPPPKSRFVVESIDSSVGPFGIYLVDEGGSELQRLAGPGDTISFPNGPTGDTYVIGNVFHVLDPQWNPKGTEIAATLEFGTEGTAILLFNSDGSDKRVLSQIPTAAGRPKWSPDGQSILYEKMTFGAVTGRAILDLATETVLDVTLAGPAPQVFGGDSLYFTGDYQWGSKNILLASASVNRNPGSIFVLGTNDSVEIFSINASTGEILQRLTRNNFDESGFVYSSKSGVAAVRRGRYGANDNKLHFVHLQSGRIDSLELLAFCTPPMNWATDGRILHVILDEDPHPDWNDELLYPYAIEASNPPSKMRSLSIKSNSVHLYVP